MTAMFAAGSTFEPLFRDALEIGLTFVIRVALPLAFGLSALRALGRRGVEMRRVVANASLASAAVVLLLSIGSSVAPIPLPAIWSIRIPASRPFTSDPSAPHSLASHLPVAQPARANSIAVTPPALSSAAGSSGDLLAATPLLKAAEAPDFLYSGVIEAAPAMTSPSSHSADIGSHVSHGTSPAFELIVIGVMVCWLAGSAGLLVWLLFSAGTIAWRLRQGREVEDSATLTLLEDLCTRKGVCPPRLVACPNMQSPFVTGLLCPTLALPETYPVDFEPEALRAILAHEVMHLVQRDCLWTLLSRILCAFCWPLPLVWVLSRQREALSEEACDTAVLNEGCSPTVYARCLLSLAERLRPLRPERAAGVGALTARSGLGRRIERILAGPRTKHRPLPQYGRIALVAVAIVLILPGMVLVGQAAPKGPRGPGQEVEPAQSDSAPGSRSREQTDPGQTSTKQDTREADALARAAVAKQAEARDSDTKRINRWYELAKGARAKQADAQRQARVAAEAAARNMQRAERQRIRAQLAGLGAALKVIGARRESVTARLNSIGTSSNRKRRALREEQTRIMHSKSHLIQVIQGMQRHADVLARSRAAALQDDVAVRREELAAQHARLLAAYAGLAQAEKAMQSANAKYTDAAPQVQQAHVALQQAEANAGAQAEQLARLKLQRSTAVRSTADQQVMDDLERAAQVDVTAQSVRTEAAKAALAQAQSMLQSARDDYDGSAPQVQQADAALRQAQAKLAADQAAALTAQKRAVEALRKVQANIASHRVGPADDHAVAMAATKRAVDALRRAQANLAVQHAQLAAVQAASVSATRRAVEALRQAQANLAAQQARLSADQAAALAAQKRAVEALRKAQDTAAKRKTP